MDKTRKIIHIDMDAFFAAVEQRDHPDLRGKPVIVGGPPGTRSVVATCSYEARKYGIHSAMPSATAARLCPTAIFVQPSMGKYIADSERIMEIFRSFTPLVEPVSVDEAYLDVTTSHIQWGTAKEMARFIKERVMDSTGLTCSAGVSYNKFLAKMASGMQKPDGLTVISPERSDNFLMTLPVGKFHGIGKKTEQRMIQLGIYTGKELKEQPLHRLIDLFGKAGTYYWNIVRGEDPRPVETEWTRKSYGREVTLDQDTLDHCVVRSLIRKQLDEIINHLRMTGSTPRHLTIKIRYHDFRSCTRSMKCRDADLNREALYSLCCLLLKKTDCGKIPIRLVGVSVQIENQQSDHCDGWIQPELPFTLDSIAGKDDGKETQHQKQEE